MEPRYRMALHLGLLEDDDLDDEDVARRLGTKTEYVCHGRSLLRPKGQGSARRAVETAARQGVSLVTLVDDDYPLALRDLELAPPCLFCRSASDDRRLAPPFGPNAHLGESKACVDGPAASPGQLLSAPGIGIVGPRNADPYGLEAARFFARELATAGLVVTSGFARGVDAAAHEETAHHGGRTIAVLGCGVDVPYPRQNQRLVPRILETGGMLVSEFPLGVGPASWHFPIRNRLIAALTRGTVVIQASSRSGSLITARLALDLGREVYAVPGRIFDQRSRGTNLLLRDGAHAALGPESILDTLDLATRAAIVSSRSVGEPDATGAREGSVREHLLSLLAHGPVCPEEVARERSVPIAQLSSIVALLELDGTITRAGGGRFHLKSSNRTSKK